MSRVLTFLHRGLTCAIPADQALGVDEGAEDDSLAFLWPIGEREASRKIRVSTADGEHHLECVDPYLRDLDPEAVVPLSPLLREILGELPHVVGFATFDDAPVWLVDLRRFRGDATKEAAL